MESSFSESILSPYSEEQKISATKKDTKSSHLFENMGVKKNYWCYNCKKKFSKLYIENTTVECIFCYSQICEEILPSYENNILPPDKFRPYSTLPQEEEPTVVRLTNPNNALVQFIMNLINMEYENDEIENILNYIINNDTNRYGSPPAAKSEVQKLNKYDLTKEKLESFGNENTCSVCKEDFVIGSKLMDLPCKHAFHEECLMPWLNQHDSCPICRYELKTDDEDYEKMKLQRNGCSILQRNENTVNNNNSVNNNSINEINEERENSSQKDEEDVKE